MKDFIAYAYHKWKGAPRYVLLLGDASYDFKNNLGAEATNHVPPLMIMTTYMETVSDPSYAAVNGDDILPDLAVGRLPASSVEELQQLIAKIVAWETDVGRLDGRAVVVADNPHAAGDFVRNADQIATGVLSALETKKIYLSELGTVRTRAEIQRALDEGASLMSYIGHGGINLWAHENIWNVKDVPSLTEQFEQPLLLTLNCLNGYFHYPYVNSLAEEMLKARGKGVVAAFSPSGLSINSAAHVYHRLLLEALLEGGYERLGDAVLAAQDAYAETGAFPELLSIYHLLGDPALRLK